VAGKRLVRDKPLLGLRDFSGLVNRALYEYIEEQEPGLVAKVAREIREGRAPEAQQIGMAAEDPAPYGAKSKEPARGADFIASTASALNDAAKKRRGAPPSRAKR
jgi:hypothetical protein